MQSEAFQREEAPRLRQKEEKSDVTLRTCSLKPKGNAGSLGGGWPPVGGTVCFMLIAGEGFVGKRGLLLGLKESRQFRHYRGGISQFERKLAVRAGSSPTLAPSQAQPWRDPFLWSCWTDSRRYKRPYTLNCWPHFPPIMIYRPGRKSIQLCWGPCNSILRGQVNLCLPAELGRIGGECASFGEEVS